MELKGNSIEFKYVFKIWLNQSGKSSIVDVQLGSRYAPVSITSFNIVYRKLMKFLKCYLAKEK